MFFYLIYRVLLFGIYCSWGATAQVGWFSFWEFFYVGLFSGEWSCVFWVVEVFIKIVGVCFFSMFRVRAIQVFMLISHCDFYNMESLGIFSIYAWYRHGASILLMPPHLSSFSPPLFHTQACLLPLWADSRNFLPL